MRILVTGGAGFIGSNLIHYLLGEAALDQGTAIEKVINLDLLTYAGNPENLKGVEEDPRYFFEQGDICDSDFVGGVLRQHQITHVLHLAAESHVDRSIENPEAFVRTNVLGTFTLLEEYRKHYRSINEARRPTFLHVSTDEVYGSLGEKDPAFSETTRYAPNSPYSASKAGSDHLVRAYFHTYGMPVVTTNCSNNYGPFQFPEKLIPLMIHKVLKNEALPVYGNGSNIRDWLYVRDHARGLVCALIKGIHGETYALGGRCEMKNIDVVRTLIKTVMELSDIQDKRSGDEMIAFVKDRPGHDQRYAIDCSRAEHELGWLPQENFSSGMLKTVRWYLDHQPWIQAIENGSYRGERLGTIA